MLNKLPTKLIIGFIALFLAGCAMIAPVAPVQPTLTWQQRQAQLSAIKNWTLRSSFSIREGGQATLASIYWQQQGRYFTQRISGPFSLGGVIIQGTPGRVTLIRSANDQVSASTPEELLAKELNMHLPISNLFYWIRGIPVPGIPASTKLDSQNRLLTLQQSGWQITYVSYTTVNGIDLPSTILLNNWRLQIKMVIKQWQI